MSADPDFDALINDYRASIPEKMANFNQLLEAFKSNPTKETLEPFKKAVHKLAGSAGMYGFNEVTTMCKKMETELQGDIDTELKGDLSQRLETFLTELKDKFV